MEDRGSRGEDWWRIEAGEERIGKGAVEDGERTEVEEEIIDGGERLEA